MFTKGNRVYADTYKYLRHKTKAAIGITMVADESEVEEVVMELPIVVSINGNMVTWENGKLAFFAKDKNYASIKEQLVKSRYTNDEQLAIMLNKDSSEDSQLCYQRMQEWRSFAEEMARLVNEEDYQATTGIKVAKEKKKAEILRYDSSEHVNSFTIENVKLWIDKATRVGLKLRFEAEKRLDKIETTLWQNGMQFPLPLEGEVTALDMLDGIELYASACYDTTQRHLAEVEKLETVDEVMAYDYTSGYPQKLVF